MRKQFILAIFVQIHLLSAFGQSSKLAGTYRYVNNTGNRICGGANGLLGNLRLNISNDGTFAKLYVTTKDTNRLEEGKWQLSADTLILNYTKTKFKGIYRTNCYVTDKDTTHYCYEYEEYLVQRKDLYSIPYDQSNREKLLMTFKRE